MMRLVHRLGALFFAVSVAAAGRAETIPTLSPPAPATVLQSPAEALTADATVYAARYGVGLQEAMARLGAQEASVAATDAIAREFGDRLASISIEHKPTYRIVVRLTGDARVPDRLISAGGLSVPVVFRTGAPTTRQQILAAIDTHQADIRQALVDPPGLGVDPRTGKLLLAIGADDARRALLDEIEDEVAEIAGVPVHAFVMGRETDFAVGGGEIVESIDHQAHRRYRCTSGFVVTDGSRTAIATAAHCPDDLTHIAWDGTRTPLTMIGAWGAGHQDVQIHAAADAMAPLFHAGDDAGTVRTLATWRARSTLRAGDFVCHQGVTSGYSCAEVIIPDYAPPGDLCAGPCPATWVAVAGPHCAHGDSGGPVFLGETAFGLVKGGSYRPDGGCTFYYFMSTDYLPEGWSPLTR